ITLIIKIYYFCNSVVSPTVRAEAKTIIRENTLKDRCKNLGHSLLNHSVHHCWYSEFSYSTIRLRNFYPFDWCWRSEEHTSELQSRFDLVCRLLLEKKK